MSNCIQSTVFAFIDLGDAVLSMLFGFNGLLKSHYQIFVHKLYPHVEWPLALLGFDIEFIAWLICVLAPFLLIVVIPVIFFLLLYSTYLLVSIVRLKHRFTEIGHNRDWQKAARLLSALMWQSLGRIWNGYEVRGFDKLPQEENAPAMLVYYHGEIPIDCYYLLSELIINGQNKVKVVADRCLFRVPGWKTMLDALSVMSGTREECESALNNGSTLVLSPGGTREMLYSDANYKVCWGSRLGYAKIAMKCKVPIYPVFTRNIREVFRFSRMWPLWDYQMAFYEKFKFPVALIYGGFPSKLITYIGDPIKIDAEMDVSELNSRVQKSLQSLISSKQPIPGSILRAIWERLCPPPVD